MSRLASIALGALAGVLVTLWWPAASLPPLLQAWSRLEAGAQLVSAALFITFVIIALGLLHRSSLQCRCVRAGRKIQSVGFGVAAFLAFVLVAAAHVQPALDQRVSPLQSGQHWRLMGSIATIPEPVTARGGERAWRFEVTLYQAERFTTASAITEVSAAVDASRTGRHQMSLSSSPQRVRLTMYVAAQSDAAAEVPRLGEHWQIEARLFAPVGAVNPAAFDYERWLFQRGLAATGSWVAGSRIQKADGIARLRTRLYDALTQALPEGDARAVLQALVIGERGTFDDHLWESLRRTGTSHLVAISGLHVGLLAALAYGLTSFLWRRSARLCRLLAAPRAAALLALLMAALYAALAGFAIPTQRALWMLAVVLLAQFNRYRMQVMDVLAIALLGVLVLDVRAVLAIGFWLSFAAVGLIAFFLQLRRSGVQASAMSMHKPAWWRASVSAVRIQFGLGLGMIPLLLLWFGQVSWASPWVNLIAVPLIGWLVVPLALIASTFLLLVPPIGIWLIRVLEQGLDVILGGLHRIAAMEWAMSSPQYWPLGSLLLLMLAMGAFGWAWLQRQGERQDRHPRRWGLVGLSVLLVALLLREPASLGSHTVLLRVYDAGRGYAVSIRSAERTVLIDAGLRSGPHFDSGRDVLVPALRAEGVNRLDRIWLTGDRGDHQGGLPGIVQGMEVGEIVSAMDCAAEQGRWPLTPKLGIFWLESHATAEPGVCLLVLHGLGMRWIVSGAAPALGVAPPESVRTGAGETGYTGVIFSGHGKSAEQWPFWMKHIEPEQSFVVRGRPRRYEMEWPALPAFTARTGSSGLLEIRLELREDGFGRYDWSAWRNQIPQIWRWTAEELQARN